jgi:hypothetical protein
VERAAKEGLAARLFGSDPARALALLREAWPRAVGPELARRTEAVALDRGTLRVRVPDGRWRKVLHRMQPEILGRLRRIAGSVAPHRLGFVEGDVAEKALPESAPVARPVPLPPELAARIEAIPDPEIRARFAESAARYLGRRAN